MKNDLENLPFSSEDFKNTWNEWLEYRKERKLPKYVPRGLKMTFTKLVNESDSDERTAIKMIENSIARNWNGIFKINIYGNIKSIGGNGATLSATAVIRPDKTFKRAQ